MAVIPGGLTSKMQPLDVAINKSFKSKKNIDPILIQKSFKCCSISNVRDSSKDHLIFDYDQLIVNNKLQNTNYVFKNEEEEANSIYNGEGSSMNQMLDNETQFDNDSDNSEENKIDNYEKESLEEWFMWQFMVIIEMIYIFAVSYYATYGSLIFYNINFKGIAFQNLKGTLYPCVGLYWQGQAIEVNFVTTSNDIGDESLKKKWIEAFNKCNNVTNTYTLKDLKNSLKINQDTALKF
ncbi:hypothetical protein C2G38_2163489 [Gigaspora rosea]|uniref:Uncharacterized protein n=1 Tax=Gigaspora rosea TaxID=44941 RepID=A0A397VZG4_9GLOM|nr:hypothetical protein C2G38_2163489 [Gigaspora rosea]